MEPEPTRTRTFHYPAITGGTAHGVQFPDGRVVIAHPGAGLIGGTTLDAAIVDAADIVTWDDEETAARLVAYERLEAAARALDAAWLALDEDDPWDSEPFAATATAFHQAVASLPAPEVTP